MQQQQQSTAHTFPMTTSSEFSEAEEASSVDGDHSTGYSLGYQRELALNNFKSVWEAILTKYSDPKITESADIIDLDTGEIIEDNGHLASIEKTRSVWDDGEHRGTRLKEAAKMPENEKPPPPTPSLQQKQSSAALEEPAPKAPESSSKSDKPVLDEDAFDNLLTPPVKSASSRRRAKACKSASQSPLTARRPTPVRAGYTRSATLSSPLSPKKLLFAIERGDDDALVSPKRHVRRHTPESADAAPGSTQQDEQPVLPDPQDVEQHEDQYITFDEDHDDYDDEEDSDDDLQVISVEILQKSFHEIASSTERKIKSEQVDLACEEGDSPNPFSYADSVEQNRRDYIDSTNLPRRNRQVKESCQCGLSFCFECAN